MQDCARLSAGCAVRAMEATLASGRPDANAFAAIRPPGHHASQNSPCGFCIFNNIAICAKKVVSKLKYLWELLKFKGSITWCWESFDHWLGCACSTRLVILYIYSTFIYFLLNRISQITYHKSIKFFILINNLFKLKRYPILCGRRVRYFAYFRSTLWKWTILARDAREWIFPSMLVFHFIEKLFTFFQFSQKYDKCAIGWNWVRRCRICGIHAFPRSSSNTPMATWAYSRFLWIRSSFGSVLLFNEPKKQFPSFLGDPAGEMEVTPAGFAYMVC